LVLGFCSITMNDSLSKLNTTCRSFFALLVVTG
jgi:hypothetical protein